MLCTDVCSLFPEHFKQFRSWIPVGREFRGALKFFYGLAGLRTNDTVDWAGVKSLSSKKFLNFFNLVAAEPFFRGSAGLLPGEAGQSFDRQGVQLQWHKDRNDSTAGLYGNYYKPGKPDLHVLQAE